MVDMMPILWTELLAWNIWFGSFAKGLFRFIPEFITLKLDVALAGTMPDSFCSFCHSAGEKPRRDVSLRFISLQEATADGR